MQGKSKADLKKLMSISDNIAALNHRRFKDFLCSEKANEDMPGGAFRPAVSNCLACLFYRITLCIRGKPTAAVP